MKMKSSGSSSKRLQTKALADSAVAYADLASQADSIAEVNVLYSKGSAAVKKSFALDKRLLRCKDSFPDVHFKKKMVIFFAFNYIRKKRDAWKACAGKFTR